VVEEILDSEEVTIRAVRLVQDWVIWQISHVLLGYRDADNSTNGFSKAQQSLERDASAQAMSENLSTCSKATSQATAQVA
jgi:hypothetical protein